MKKRILLTGDDGYNSIGTRLLISGLKQDFDLTVCGTKNQQSGVGGRFTQPGGACGETTVDGVRALWVDGSPVDAILCARTYFGNTFDLTISGMNLGINVSAEVFTSGTFCAAQRAVIQGISPHAIAVSYDIHFSKFHASHTGADPLDEYMEYPGKMLQHIITLSIRKKYWGAKMLNINLPSQPTAKVRFTHMLQDTYDYWPPAVVDIRAGKFSYPLDNPKDRAHDIRYDTTAVAKGYISVSPIDMNMTYTEKLRRIQQKEISLDL